MSVELDSLIPQYIVLREKRYLLLKKQTIACCAYFNKSHQMKSLVSHVEELKHKLESRVHFLWRRKNPKANDLISELEQRIIKLQTDLKPLSEAELSLRKEYLTVFEKTKYLHERIIDLIDELDPNQAISYKKMLVQF